MMDGNHPRRNPAMPTLNWLNRNEALALSTQAPYRLLEPVPALSAGSAETENMLIQGDNLDALKALLPYYAGRVKCIYIDPPYNTGSAFEQYDDNLEHSTWLSLIYPRLELLRDLLAEDGSVWVTLDDNEAHYVKVVMDEIFGRSNFIGSTVWEKSDSPRMDAVFFLLDTIIFWFTRGTFKRSFFKKYLLRRYQNTTTGLITMGENITQNLSGRWADKAKPEKHVLIYTTR
jgi:adenine-specific DNA-methyltransferase